MSNLLWTSSVTGASVVPAEFSTRQINSPACLGVAPLCLRVIWPVLTSNWLSKPRSGVNGLSFLSLKEKYFYIQNLEKSNDK